MNAGIQVLKSRIPDNKIDSLACQHDFDVNCIDCAFSSLMHQMTTQSNSTPHLFVNFLTDNQFSDALQDDAYNFLTHMLFTLSYNFSRAFLIKHDTNISCVNGCEVRRLVENYLSFTLDINEHSTLEDAFSSYFFTVEMEALCDCGGHQTKTFAISEAPTSLLLHLKRFVQLENGKYAKLTHAVQIPQQFVLNFGSDNVSYKFSSAIMHSGTEYKRGHYTTYVMRQNQLHLCDDSIVKVTDFSQIDHTQTYIVIFDKCNDSDETMIVESGEATSQFPQSPPASPFKGFSSENASSRAIEAICKLLTIFFFHKKPFN